MIDIQAVILSPLLSGFSYLHAETVTGLHLSPLWSIHTHTHTSALAWKHTYAHTVHILSLHAQIQHMAIIFACCIRFLHSPPLAHSYLWGCCRDSVTARIIQLSFEISQTHTNTQVELEDIWSFLLMAGGHICHAQFETRDFDRSRFNRMYDNSSPSKRNYSVAHSQPTHWILWNPVTRVNRSISCRKTRCRKDEIVERQAERKRSMR